MIPVIGSRFFIDTNDINWVKINEKYKSTHVIEAVWGIKPRLDKLQSNQKVCWGDGETYHFRLTEKS